jgi:hypothetical protein
MERCIECGANLALVGRRHNCRPRSQPTEDEPQATPFISMDEAGVVDIHPNEDEAKPPSKSPSRRPAAKTKPPVPKRADQVKEIAESVREAAKTKFTIRLDPATVKQIKVTSAEREITMERFVELAIKEKLEG